MTSEPLVEFFSQFSFSPVIEFPPDYEVYDFTESYDPHRQRSSAYGVGRYNEKRPGMYQGELYEDLRDIHIGIDLAAPVGTEVRAFYAGEVVHKGYNAAQFDYGWTLVTLHHLGARELYVLWGHLSKISVEKHEVGQVFAQGDTIARLGDRDENGGWNPHLHFQLSWMRPERADLPGVVRQKDLEWALETFPDPRLVLGPLY